VHQLLQAQPFQQLDAIGGIEDFAQGIGFFQALDVLPGGQQVQVVIAEHADQRIADVVEKAQGLKRLWAPIDQIAHQPQRVFLWVEGDPFQQAFERVQATLQIAGLMIASKRVPSSASIWYVPCMVPTLVVITVPLL